MLKSNWPVKLQENGLLDNYTDKVDFNLAFLHGRYGHKGLNNIGSKKKLILEGSLNI